MYGTCRADGAREGLGEFLGQPGNDDHAFAYKFHPALSLYREYRLEIRNADTGELVPSGARTIHPIHATQSMLAPILVTSRGRAGTTLLMKQLLGHPEVAVADTIPFEVEIMTYYVTALSVLLPPRFDGTHDDPDMAEAALETGQIGRNPWNRPALHYTVGGEELERLYTESVPLRMASLFRNIVLDYYGIVARKSEKRQARFLAEKCGLSDNTRLGIRGLMGEVKEIVLIRDPRDFLCSAKAFWKFDSERAFATMTDVFPIYMRLAAQAASDTILVRYEDLVAKSRETLERIGAFIGLTGLGANVETGQMFQGHGTSASPSDSIGRWRRDLTPDEIGRCNERFGAFMERFHYA